MQKYDPEVIILCQNRIHNFSSLLTIISYYAPNFIYLFFPFLFFSDFLQKCYMIFGKIVERIPCLYLFT